MTAAMGNGSVGGGCTKHKRNCAKIVVTKEQDTHIRAHIHAHTTCEKGQLQDIINVCHTVKKKVFLAT